MDEESGPAAMRPTIRDVARAAGVALSTVSNALLGRPNVRAETRERIEAIANSLGYRPSPAARAMRARRSFNVGVLVADVANPTFSDIVRGIEDVLIVSDFRLFLCNTDGDIDKQVAYMRDMIDRQVDGLILLSQNLEDPRIVSILSGDFATVAVHRRNLRTRFDYVGLNNADAIRKAVRHLVELGHKRIGFVRGPQGSTAAAERLRSFNGAMKASGLTVEPAHIVQGDYKFAGGVKAGRLLLAGPRRPTAILASNDLCAIGIMEAASQAGLAVPADLSVIGFDDIFLASLPLVGLTSLHQPRREIGAAAARLLLSRIADPRGAGPARQEIFDAELVIRKTTAPRTVKTGRAKR